MKGNEMLHVLVFQEGGDWVAQCLEYDICTHAHDEQTLQDRFCELLEVEYQLSTSGGREPFSGIKPAPEEFHDRWRQASDGAYLDTPAGAVELKKCA